MCKISNWPMASILPRIVTFHWASKKIRDSMGKLSFDLLCSRGPQSLESVLSISLVLMSFILQYLKCKQFLLKGLPRPKSHEEKSNSLDEATEMTFTPPSAEPPHAPLDV